MRGFLFISRRSRNQKNKGQTLPAKNKGNNSGTSPWFVSVNNMPRCRSTHRNLTKARMLRGDTQHGLRILFNKTKEQRRL